MTVFRPLKVRPAVLLDYRSLELEFLGRKDISFQNFIQVWNDLQFGFVQVGCRSELQERRELFAELCECAWHRMGREQATVEVKFGMESEQCLIIVMNNMQEQTCAILALFCFYHTQTCTPPQKLRITPLQGQRLKELREICSVFLFFGSSPSSSSSTSSSASISFFPAGASSPLLSTVSPF
eukprot:m.166689 g.166689  ORF g.166689 m.166689 type:complete len:182 (-) comp15290_c0_seq5:1701-2246(-)